MISQMNKYRLNIESSDKKILLSFDDLIKKYPENEVITTIQCAGNRRNEFNKNQKTLGIPWQNGSISTAK